MPEKITPKDMMIGGGALVVIIAAIWFVMNIINSQRLQAGPPPKVTPKGQKMLEMEQAQQAAQGAGAAKGGQAPTTTDGSVAPVSEGRK
jgi:hypothetical protein